MRSRSLAAQHDAAVARRLELLTSDLAAVRERGPSSGPTASVARLPGRHASRRTTPATAWRVPAWSAGHVALVAVLTVLALVVTCWWLLRSGGHEVTAPVALATPRSGLATPRGATGGAAPAALADQPSGEASAPGSAPAATARVVVDVTGKVRSPGIVVLRQGARVVDALRAAGGARRGVDLSGLNLARVLADGEQVVVGARSVLAATGTSPASGPPVTGLVDLNTADESTLDSLPEVGPVTAQAIITWRSEHGGYTSVDQLLDVDGIGDATLAKLTPYVTL
jgi:competence protein ComEA